MKASILALLVVSITACASMPTGSAQETSSELPPYSYEETEWARSKGKNVIEGTAFLSAGAQSLTCEAEMAVLRPRSALTDYRKRVIFGSVERGHIPFSEYPSLARPALPNLPAPPAEYEADARRVKCASGGKFIFTDIPDGTYYLRTLVLPPERADKPVPMDLIEVVMKRVSVRGGQTLRVDLFKK